MEVLNFLQSHQYGKGLSTLNKDRVYRGPKATAGWETTSLDFTAGEQWWWCQGQGSGFNWHWMPTKPWVTLVCSAFWTVCNATTGGGAWGTL